MTGTPVDADSWAVMLEAVQAFHHKHRFRETGGEELTYIPALNDSDAHAELFRQLVLDSAGLGGSGSE